MNIGAGFDLRSYSLVGSVPEGMKRLLAEDSDFCEHLKRAREGVLRNTNGQTQT